MAAKIYLKKGEGRILQAGGCWIFDNEIEKVTGSYNDGEIVEVFDPDEHFLARGYINSHSKIRVRVLTRDPDKEVDDAFWHNRLLEAWQYRKNIGDTENCRVIFGQADGLPGLVVDKYHDILVMQAETLGIDQRKMDLMKDLMDILAKDGHPVKGVYERSDAKVRTLEGLERVKGILIGEFEPRIEIVENDVRFMVDIENGQKTGHFLDQKENRKAIWRICKDARVLDCFTHTGAFALNAGKAGAKEVTGVDASDTAIAQANENRVLNGLENVVSFKVADVLDLLPELVEKGEQYDVVILDPPAFTKSRNSLKNAMKGYREINRLGMKLVKPGGFLVSCSCSENLTPELFEKVINEAARSAKKRLRQVEYRTQSADHPIVWGNPATNYLKFVVLQVVDRW